MTGWEISAENPGLTEGAGTQLELNPFRLYEGGVGGQVSGLVPPM